MITRDDAVEGKFVLKQVDLGGGGTSAQRN